MNSNQRDPADKGRPRNVESDIGQLFGPSINRMVSQYQAALRGGLDKEIEKIVDDFQKASVGSDETVAKRMRSRIEELVSEEVRRVFDNTLHSAERSFVEPIRARAAELHGPDTHRDEPKGRHQSRRRNRTESPGSPEANATGKVRSQPPISGSVAEGYPGARTSPSDQQPQRRQQNWSFNDQEAPIDAEAPVQGQSQHYTEGHPSNADHGPTHVSPASWVLPGGNSPLDKAAQAEHDPVGDEIEAKQSHLIATETHFEPDDEVDPFVASMDDDLSPETDYYFEDEYDQEDTSELPDDALTAVMSENTDLTTIAHDSNEVVHVPSNYDQPFDDNGEDQVKGISQFESSLSVDDAVRVDVEPVDENDSFVEIAVETTDNLDVLDVDMPPATLEDLANRSAEDELPSVPDADDSSEVEEPLATMADDGEFPVSDDDNDDLERDVAPLPATNEEFLADSEPVVIASEEFLAGAEPDVIAIVDFQTDAEPEAVSNQDVSEAHDAPKTAEVHADEESAPIIEATQHQDGPTDVPQPADEATNAVVEAPESPEAHDAPGPAAVEEQVEQPVHPLSGSVEIDNEVAEGEEIPEAATFEGTVRLNVEAHGCIKEIVHFVRELRQKPELRLLRLVGNNKEGVDIWLGLREPLRIKSMLPEIEGVNISVRPLPHVGGNDEKLLGVRMTRVLAAEAVSEVS